MKLDCLCFYLLLLMQSFSLQPSRSAGEKKGRIHLIAVSNEKKIPMMLRKIKKKVEKARSKGKRDSLPLIGS